MRPYNGGGEMIREVARDWVTYGDPPHKFEAGTPAIVESIGLGAAIDYVNSIGKERIAAHEHDLLTYAVGRLREINSLRLIGTARGKGPVISFEMKGAHSRCRHRDRPPGHRGARRHPLRDAALERRTATCRASVLGRRTPVKSDHLAQALIKGAGIHDRYDRSQDQQHGNQLARRRRRPSGSACEIVAALKPCSIRIADYELGLIYKVDIDDRTIDVMMTLTTPNCPGGRRVAADGGKRGRQRSRRRRGQCQLSGSRHGRRSNT